MLQDIHVHLQDIQDRRLSAAIIARAEEQGVGRLVCNATSPADWDAVGGIAMACPSVIPFFGVHPWFARSARVGWDAGLKSHLTAFARSGIGEIGLDYRKSRADFALQETVFTRQLDIAFELNRPIQIHCVEAWGRMLELFRERPMKNIPFMFHLFSGSAEVLTELLAMGAHVSFSLGIADGGPEKVRRAFQATPLDRLLLETDFPYMPGKRYDASVNSDGYFGQLKGVYAIAAAQRGISADALEKAVWTNGSAFVR